MKNEIRFTLESKQRPKLAQEIGNILAKHDVIYHLAVALIDLPKPVFVIFQDQLHPEIELSVGQVFHTPR